MRDRIACGVLALMLAGCGGVLPHESNIDTAKFETYDQLMSAYGEISPGTTKAEQLAALGFDPMTTPNTEILSYTGIVQRFMPTDAVTFNLVPKPVQACIAAENGCSGYVYRFQNASKQRNGGVVPDLLGIERNTLDLAWAAEIVLLVQNDRVVYKVISTRQQSNLNDSSQPLGPIQNIEKNIGNPSSP
ncbi:MAG: hypothetical protein KGJ78_11630 [Alphaproteobacteria bacterium]|nr:hypothetical protein [Alphaproteobacteria bacterium]